MAVCVSSRRQCVDSQAIPAGADVFYPTSDVALRQPEHQAAVTTLSHRLRVHTQAVYSTVAPDNLVQELTALRAPEARDDPPLGYLLLESVRHREFRHRARFRAPAGAGSAHRRLDRALLA